ncbi:GNAT family N-acetyltransferase [Bacillus sp. RG28]|uniref:GNAT family N-acetyltransferase n=2 Tax=Gottfriedia endophytica TaxID=2820819 RepID=A0A940NUG4_9BACI|nr:GNAT family N-acetyltransferase [Gottfriedia endophytica]
MKADFLISEVPDHLNDSVSFIEMNGYKKERHVWQSTLDLPTFDEKINGSIIEEVNIRGITFASLSEMDVKTVKTPLYKLFKQTVKDNPAMNDDENSLPSLEDGSNEFLANSNIAIIAFSESRIVGMTILIPKADGELYNEWTGVDKEFRGQKISLALKLKSIQTAKASRYNKKCTDNDSLNKAMISVNQKLGYISVPGGHFVVSKYIKVKSD